MPLESLGLIWRGPGDTWMVRQKLHQINVAQMDGLRSLGMDGWIKLEALSEWVKRKDRTQRKCPTQSTVFVPLKSL